MPAMKLPWATTGGDERGSPRGLPTRTDAWDRWSWAWYAAFYALLVVTTVIAVAFPGGGGRAWQAVVLTAALGGTHAATLLFTGGWGRRIPLKLVYVAAAAALWFLLVGLHPVYFLMLFVLFGQIYQLLPPRWAIPCSLALTAVVTARFLVDNPPSAAPSVLLQGLFWAVFGTFWAAWVYSIISQSRKRQDLIDELEATRAELAAQERRTGILEERGRLSREIHDTLAQGFTSIVAHLETAEAALPPDAETSHNHLALARETARENLSEARHLVAELRPEILAGSSLPEALDRLTRRGAEETGVAATLSTTGEPRELPQEQQVAFLRATQEALQNVRKHAGASAVTVTLSYMDDSVALDVQDDGSGFDPARVREGPDGGFGLRAMRERVESLGGRLVVESEPGKGATLAVELPRVAASQPVEAVEERA